MSRSSVDGARKGFTLVELAVVIVIIGVLAAFGVPQFLKSVERSKAAEAFNYLSAVRSAQERYIAKNGIYWAGTISGTTGAMTSAVTGAETLDTSQVPPKYFSGDGTAGTDITVTEDHATPGQPAWTCTLTRIIASSSYGGYTVVYDQTGFLPLGSTLPAGDNSGATVSTIPVDISPMGG